jgi:hypothetical protein
MVRAAADWRRAGVERPITSTQLAEVLPVYTLRKHASIVAEQCSRALSGRYAR